ncbi:MAG TPA: TraR/DksA C4-type zinc finger protein [Verrucomicrobiales bacterium]|jgi:RNA polymerase-binding transcription factor DksA|nr:TraR/DksA C4-type zinc finger protein [Verrucomicrobiales bacterium]
MPGKAKPKSSKPAPKAVKKPAAKPAAKKPVAKKPAVAKKAAKLPKAAKSAPRNAKSDQKSKAKAVVKKKPAPVSSNGSSTSVRRTRGKENSVRETQLKPGTNFRAPGRPLAPVEQWDAPPEIPRSAFTKKQRTKLLDLKDSLVDSMSGMAEDTLRMRAEGSEASAFGMHQADAGSDAYDRDFALSLLSKEQDALYEIDEALKRIDAGNYGICEMSGKPIPQARLEALPFARFTIECQAEYEREVGPGGGRRPLRSLFGLMGDEDEDGEEGEEKETVDKSDD